MATITSRDAALGLTARRLPDAIILNLLFISLSFAQHAISGRVIDGNNEPLTYAHVVLLAPIDSTLKYFDVADDNGI